MQGSFQVREYGNGTNLSDGAKKNAIQCKDYQKIHDEKGRPLNLVLPGIGKFDISYDDVTNEMVFVSTGFVSWYDLPSGDQGDVLPNARIDKPETTSHHASSQLERGAAAVWSRVVSDGGGVAAVAGRTETTSPHK